MTSTRLPHIVKMRSLSAPAPGRTARTYLHNLQPPLTDSSGDKGFIQVITVCTIMHPRESIIITQAGKGGGIGMKLIKLTQ